MWQFVCQSVILSVNQFNRQSISQSVSPSICAWLRFSSSQSVQSSTHPVNNPYPWFHASFKLCSSIILRQECRSKLHSRKMIHFLINYTQGYSWKSFVYSIKLAIVGINFFFFFFIAQAHCAYRRAVGNSWNRILRSQDWVDGKCVLYFKLRNLRNLIGHRKASKSTSKCFFLAKIKFPGQPEWPLQCGGKISGRRR